MCFAIWVIETLALCAGTLGFYMDDFGDEHFSPSNVYYDQLPLEQYHPLWTKNFFPKKSFNKFAANPFPFKVPFESSSSLLSEEQRLIPFAVAPSKPNSPSDNNNYFNREQVINYNHLQNSPSDPVETEVYHVKLPPVIVDHTGQYHRVPAGTLVQMLKGAQALNRLQPQGVHYAAGNSHYVNSQLPFQHSQHGQPTQQVPETASYIPLRDIYQNHKLVDHIDRPYVHYYSLPHNHNYHHSYLHNHQITQPYSPVITIPPRSAAKPLLVKSEIKVANTSTAPSNQTNNPDLKFSQRDDGAFGNLRGIETPPQPQGRADGTAQRYFNTPPFNRQRIRSKEPPGCVNGTNTTFCLEDDEYPSEIIRLSMNNNQFLLERILADPTDSSSINLVEGVDGNSTSGNIREKNGTGSRDGNYICSSTVTYARPLRASNIDGDWKVIVNLKEREGGAKYSQTVRLEECR
ncbi:uncharacterized protein [Centruroides vittatus]|uniref:uncharacterized protein n=1 Tax=Centruroides vittatus TaxID=120091 RepID=UPI00350F4866